MKALPPLYVDPLPPIDLRHMLVLSDDTTILQHATSATPNLHHGYCTDDTARALIAGVYYYDLKPQVADAGSGAHEQLTVAMHRYLAFLAYAFNEDNGRFRNFMNYDRTWLEEIGSEDSHARALWGLGITVRRGHMNDICMLADEIFRKALRVVPEFYSLRPCAYALLGIDEYLRSTRDVEAEPACEYRDLLAQRLWERWTRGADDEWPWWENVLSWGNAKLPHALLIAGLRLDRQDIVDAGLKSLSWLLDVQTGDDGQLSVIGNDGWYVRGKKKARYDQQPIEAKALVQACLTAALISRDVYWTNEAKRCFEWFTGRNDAGKPMYNPNTGGGFDGLSETGISANQGAESTLAYLLSVLELHRYERAFRASQDLIP